ncbi:hypothetical protein CEW46_21435 [Bacillus cereus]|nr:hypothetical protein CEW46_21435 [Bacillus cereus]
MQSQKSFGMALVIWLFFGGLGAHRMYIKESVHYILWYWLATICTIGILPIVDLFLMSGMIKEANRKSVQEEMAIRNQYKQ